MCKKKCFASTRQGTCVFRLHPLQNLWLLSNSLMCESLTSIKEEQSMKQNGSLCSVIAGNLAEVSLATQTWFLTEDEESSRNNAHIQQRQPWFCFPVSPPLSVSRRDHSNAERVYCPSHKRKLSDESHKSEMILAFTLELWEGNRLYSKHFSCLLFIKGLFSFTKHSEVSFLFKLEIKRLWHEPLLSISWSEINKEGNLIWR